MFKRFSKRGKVVAAVMSAALVATAFTSPGGCTVTVDQNLVDQVVNGAQDWVGSGYFEAGWQSGPGPSDSPGQGDPSDSPQEPGV